MKVDDRVIANDPFENGTANGVNWTVSDSNESREVKVTFVEISKILFKISPVMICHYRLQNLILNLLVRH